MHRMAISAFAKVNLALDVIGLRPDGYHDVSMVMQSVAIADRLTLEEDGDIRVTSNNPLLPTGPDNLVYKAALALRRMVGDTPGVHIHIEKSIPVAAGLGGGSADAAGVLVGLNQFWNLGLSDEQLAACGLSLGADVPFCIRGGTAWAQGIGEKLTSLPTKEGIWLVLVKLPLSVGTARIYREWDHLIEPEHPRIEAVVRQIQSGTWNEIPTYWGNTLEGATFRLYPEVRDLWNELRREWPAVRMSGSGPTLFLWDLSEDKARRLAAKFRIGSIWAEAVKTCGQGVTLLNS